LISFITSAVQNVDHLAPKNSLVWNSISKDKNVLIHQPHLNMWCTQTMNFTFNVSWSVRASSYIPISRPTDATCDRFLSSIYICITVHVSSVKRSSSGVPHRTYSLQFLCLCLSAALPCKKFSYKTVPQTDTNTQTGGCMYGEGLLMMSAWRSKHVQLYTYK
jgi:hypothetical protein